MPNRFTLTRKSDPNAGPVPLRKVDEEICAMMGVPVHPRLYHLDWYGTIGFALAMGDTFEKIQADIVKGDWVPMGPLLHIATWLDENFVANAWVERK